MSDISEKGSDFLRDLGNAARKNPLSTALIGMGVLWLFTGSRPVERAEEIVRRTARFDRIPAAGNAFEAARSTFRSGADSIGAGSVRLVIEVSRFELLYSIGLEVHAAGIDWRRTRLRTGILEEDDVAAGPLPIPCHLRACTSGAKSVGLSVAMVFFQCNFTSMICIIVSKNMLVKRDCSLGGIRFIKNS